MRSSTRGAATDIPTKAMLPFTLITFGLAWGLGMLLVMVPQIEQSSDR